MVHCRTTYVGRNLRRLIVPVRIVGDPWHAVAKVLDVHRQLRIQFVELDLEVTLDLLADLRRGLIGHEPQAELAADGFGDYGLGALAGESALDTVDRERGVAHAAHEHRHHVVGECDGRADRVVEVLDSVV